MRWVENSPSSIQLATNGEDESPIVRVEKERASIELLQLKTWNIRSDDESVGVEVGGLHEPRDRMQMTPLDRQNSVEV